MVKNQKRLIPKRHHGGSTLCFLWNVRITSIGKRLDLCIVIGRLSNLDLLQDCWAVLKMRERGIEGWSWLLLLRFLLWVDILKLVTGKFLSFDYLWGFWVFCFVDACGVDSEMLNWVLDCCDFDGFWGIKKMKDWYFLCCFVDAWVLDSKMLNWVFDSCDYDGFELFVRWKIDTLWMHELLMMKCSIGFLVLVILRALGY